LAPAPGSSAHTDGTEGELKQTGGKPLDQDRIWRHFQNVMPEAFAGSHARQDYLLRRVVGAGARRVLNIGIGDGYLERRLHAAGCIVASLDPDERAVSRLAAAGVAAYAGRIEAMPFADGAFDAVVASEVLEHLTVTQRRDGLDETARVLRTGGFFIGTVPYREELAAGRTVCPDCGCVFHRWGHQASFDEVSFARELPAGLRLLEVRPTAFVTIRGRGAAGAVKAVVRRLLGRLGEPIAQPNLFFIAERAT
jgi:SAM-dependent methyltransferase